MGNCLSAIQYPARNFVIFVRMKKLGAFLLFFSMLISAQNIRSIQLFNPQTNDGTPVINFSEKLILHFDDLQATPQRYRYTIRHLDRNWQPDGLFFSEFATGSLNAVIEDYQHSFNTLQPYVHYSLTFPNERLKPLISGNFELIVFKDSEHKPLFTRRFAVVEDAAKLRLNVNRHTDSKNLELNQRVEVQAFSAGKNLSSLMNSLSLNIIQNNNWNSGIFHQKPTGTSGQSVNFQGLNLAFAGNNEFYYFDNKMIDQPYDMVMATETINSENHTMLFPVWAYPLSYQFQPDVNGAFYFRRNDLGLERNANTEADYAYVHFALDSEKMDCDLFVLGQFNDYRADESSKMYYDAALMKYIAKIYLKQGFYNYILATKNPDGTLDLNDINGNFWQTENLYQAFLYYRPFSGNYDGLLGYGETRKSSR